MTCFNKEEKDELDGVLNGILEEQDLKVWLKRELQEHRQKSNQDIKEALTLFQMGVKAHIDRLGSSFQGQLEPAASAFEPYNAAFTDRESSNHHQKVSVPLGAQVGDKAMSDEPTTSLDQKAGAGGELKNVKMVGADTSEGGKAPRPIDPEEIELQGEIHGNPPGVCHTASSTTRVKSRVEVMLGKKEMINSTWLDIAVGNLIVANCLVMAIQLEFAGYESLISMGRATSGTSWNNATAWFFGIEHFFNACFLAELILRLVHLRCGYFLDGQNLFDGGLVFISSIQMYILEPFQLGELGGNLTLFRLFRFVRFLRLFRVVRTMKCFSTLRVLVKTCISSFRALLWSMVLLFFVMFMGGLFLAELTKAYIRDPNNDMKWRAWVYTHYGTGTRAIYTLFEVTLAGCWPNYFRPLIERVSGWYVIFSVIYISAVVFALIRIITAIFLKETLENASGDAEMIVNERAAKRQAYTEKLKDVFATVDVDGSGRVSLDEFHTVMSEPKVKTWLTHLELEVHDAEGLFRLLDDGDGEVTYEEFLTGIMRLKGQARSIDVVAIMRTGDRTLNTCKHLQVQLDQLMQVQLQMGAVRRKEI